MSEGYGFKVLDVAARPRKTCSFVNQASGTVISMKESKACGWQIDGDIMSPGELQTWWVIEARAGGNEVLLYNRHDNRAIAYDGENKPIKVTDDLNLREAWWTIEEFKQDGFLGAWAVKGNWTFALIRSVANPKAVLDLDNGKKDNGTTLLAWAPTSGSGPNEVWYRREISKENQY